MNETQKTNLPLVYVVGDSISIQYGPYLERSLRGICRYDRKSGESEALLNLDMPQGANGGDAERVLRFLEELLKAGNFCPDVLVLNCGLHDIKRSMDSGEIQIPLETYRNRLEQITGLCREAGVTLVWVRTTHVVDSIHNTRPATTFHRFAADLQAYNACADSVMAGAGVPVIDLETFTRGLGRDEDLFCDHVHFCEPVREKQGIFLAGCLVGRVIFGKL